MKALKWTSIVLAALVALVLIFYAEEDLRGWRAWENCKHELEAKGEALDWNAYIPLPVPDDQNFFKAPKMAEWFVKPTQYPSTNELTLRMTDPRTGSVTSATNSIVTEADARSYLAWSDQFAPDFDLMREALKRPYARMDGDYSDPFSMPIPNFVAVRAVAQMLAQRAHCYLLLGQPDKALQELTLMHDMCRLLEAAPLGKPMTLVAAMINVAVTGLYTDTFANGMRLRAWQEPQQIALQKQFAQINLSPFVLQAVREEPAALCRNAEIVSVAKIFNMNSHIKWSERVCSWLWPRGWTCQNMVNVAELNHNWQDGFDPAHDTITPHKFDEAFRENDKFVSHGISPYKILAAIAIPNYTKAMQTTAHNQTLVNEAQIVCALERYRLARGEYPETLGALAPQFIEKLPHDIIGGQPLRYHRTSDGKFLLYSVGWNETDDGGQVVLKEDGSVDREKGDWVWR